MLSQSTSSNQQRRQPHRRQDSLEVSDLPESRSPTHQMENNSTTLSPTFGQLSTDDQDFQLDTNIGQFTQHTMQGTQQHSISQPGYQRHILTQQQQMDQRIHPGVLKVLQEQAARQTMQNQVQAFYQAHPGYATIQGQNTSPQLHDSPQSNLMHRATTPPNGFLPTPPSTQKTGGRVARHVVDAAPMPVAFSQAAILRMQQVAGQDMPLFPDMIGSEGNYNSSYQSSPAGMSPEQATLQAMNMSTLFEDGPMMSGAAMVMAQHQQQQMYMSANAANGHLYYPDSPMRAPLSPREAILAGLEVDASIEDTGISAEEVASFISTQDPGDSKWTCMFEGCGKKFGRKENIRSHVQTHLGDRQFRCNHCLKCFVRQHDLKRHAKIHSGDKPYRCPCGNGFARQDALTRHRQRGVCNGALPGFERREVKRGRPRKNRPELSERSDKASRARRMDAALGSDDEYASSSSPSDSGSDVFTPPQISEMDNFADLHTEAGVDAFIKAYQNTPPTSPVTTRTSPQSRPQSFDASRMSFDRLSFDVAAESSQGSPTSHYSATQQARETAAFDFASPTSVNPEQLQSPRASPVILDLQNTPALGYSTQTAQTSPALTASSTCAPSSQAEPSFFDHSLSWGAIEPQPSLVNDCPSPAAGSSPAHTDFFSDDADLFAMPRSEMLGQFAKGQESMLDEAGFFDMTNFCNEGESWLVGP